MKTSRIVALAALTVSTASTGSALAFDETKGGLLLCTTTSVKAGDDAARAKLERYLGERLLLALDVFGNVTVVYPSGTSPQWECSSNATTHTCTFPATGMSAVFDSATRRLTIPGERPQDYSVSTCEPFDLPTG